VANASWNSIPKPGDAIQRIADAPIRSFLDFADTLSNLRTMPLPTGGVLPDNADLDAATDIASFVEWRERRWVRVEYRSAIAGRRQTCWLPLQRLPSGDLLLSLVWFLMQFGIFTIGAVALWTRPRDRPVRLFFAMCAVTLVAFAGGYHWWLIAANPWLNIPFVVCALLVPVVTLHFFLVYPQPKGFLNRHTRITLGAAYGLPLLIIVAILGLLAHAWSCRAGGIADHGRVLQTLGILRNVIYVSLAIASAYFLLTIAALLHSFRNTVEPDYHEQVRWILLAGLAATVPVGYTLYLALFRQNEFALGAGSPPMFVASLLFMLAYAVGIVRFKLMLVDQLFSRGMLYYLLSFIVTAAYAMAVAASGLLWMSPTIKHVPEVLTAVSTVFVAVVLTGWVRDRFQRSLDRRFFREKYQLDKALKGVQQVSGQAAGPTVFAEHMLSACRDALGVEGAALYLRDSGGRDFRLLSASSIDDPLPVFPAYPTLLESLRRDTSLQRTTPDVQDGTSPVQRLLREVGGELLHGLELEGDIAGVVLLRRKTSGAAFTAEDVTFLTAIGQMTGVALRGAQVQQQLTEELRRRDDKLQVQQQRLQLLQAELTSREQPAAAVADPAVFQRDLIKGSSSAIQQVLETVRKVSGSDSSVLIRGESGTGKELLAQAIHENSPRRNAPIVSVHCGALSPSLLESELFGHAKGSFTGAFRDKIGRFEMANGGTLFLDEIGDISLDTQIKLLRVLQEREFEPVGGTRTVQVDVRLIAATHRHLEQLIAEGRFREDLFYRLNVIPITLPPLRERADDIFELAVFFLSRAAQRAGKPITHFDDDTLEALKLYAWPGNIRELENAIERAVVLADGPSLTVADLPPEVASYQEPTDRGGKSTLRRRSASTRSMSIVKPARFNGTFDRSTSIPAGASEREQLVQALRQSRGNKAEAARLLGLPRSTFFSRLRKHGLHDSSEPTGQ
jgi:transcriptional regulator with GAF, ATPase, and Fis domain